MYEIKLVEVRDRMTFVPALAVAFRGGMFSRLLWRAGFGEERYIILIHLTSMRAQWDVYGWHDRTMTAVHGWLSEHWEEHKDGGVVDVEYILGETTHPKASEL